MEMVAVEGNIIWILSGLLVLVVVILAAAGMYFYRTAIYPQRKDFLMDNPDLTSGTSGETWGTGKAWLDKQDSERIELESYDGLKLCGYYIAANKPTVRTAILIHGYTSRGKDMASFAQYYNEELGFNILMPDCRGHGESEGDYIGFGWHDRMDLLSWIKYIINKDGENAHIVLHGISMGGGTVLMTSGEELPPNVKCIVSDCAYTSAKGILTYQFKRMYKLPAFPLLNITSLICRLKAGYFFGEASALKQVSKARLPILFIHGGADKFVPTSMVHSLYEAAKCEKQLFIVDNAGHGDSFWMDMKGYKEHVEGFVNRYVLE